MASTPIDLLEEIKELMTLKGENPFKVRAYEKAAKALDNVSIDDLRQRAAAGTLTEIAGIGKGIAEVLNEFLLRGTSIVLDELQASLPAGLVELTTIPGLGPKKAMTLIDELGIHSISELEYACKENRLLKIKGFGEKVQQKIVEGIRFLKTTEGRKRLDEALEIAREVHHRLESLVGAARISETGALRRRLETMKEIEFLIEDTGEVRGRVERAFSGLQLGIVVKTYFAAPSYFGYELARTTGTSEHWKALGAPALFEAPNEEAFYSRLNLPWIPPEARESGEEVALAREGHFNGILPWNGIQGVFHNHTTRSDGRASLEEMVVAAKTLGYRYFGISDHSQSAFYAQGLKVPELLDQEREIRDLQDRHPEIRLFWGIESDILADGSLDYSTEVLKRFDFVVASIHSRFQMDRATMTERVLEAVRNPSTRFLGHATGRILLGRSGFEIDMERVIAEATQHNVAIEINANPARLDIDWRWGPQLRANKTPVSVNPDAHETTGLEDTLYGIAMARKAMLPSSQVINSRSVKEVERWLAREM